MIPLKDLLILSELRNNARETLTKISKKTRVPISTIFDRLKQYEGNLIIQHTTLINFSKLGFNTRANVMVKVDRDEREQVREYLLRNPNMNSVSKINNGFDFMFEALFFNIKDMEDFMEKLDQKFKILKKEVYYVIEDIKKEAFMTDPNIIGLVMNHII